MNSLLIETSGPSGLVGVARDDELIAQRRLDPGRRHAQDLAPTVEMLLREQGLKVRDMEAVIVSLGPGSYTGLRVGVMAAKAFAYAVGCKLVGVPTLPILALAAFEKIPRVEVIEDAQQGRVYSQRFEMGADGLPHERLPIRVLDHDVWFGQLDPTFTLVGPGLRKKHNCLPSHQSILPTEFWSPQLPPLLSLGMARLNASQIDDPMNLEPLYARLSSAEEQWTALGR